MDEAICVEERHLKKEWFVRNGQDTHKSENFERPVMTLVVKNIKKKNICFGPVIQVGSTPFFTGKGKNREKQEGLSFLALWKGEGFVSVIVDPKQYDMDTTTKYPNDVVVQEVVAAADQESFTNSWFQNYVSDSEHYLLPMVQAEYEQRAGAPWKNPLVRTLKIRTPISKSTSTTPSGSTARGSGTKEQEVPRQAEDTPEGPLESAATQPIPSAPVKTNTAIAETPAAQAIVPLNDAAQVVVEAATVVEEAEVVQEDEVLEEAAAVSDAVQIIPANQQPGFSDAGGSRGTAGGSRGPADVNLYPFPVRSFTRGMCGARPVSLRSFTWGICGARPVLLHSFSWGR